MGTRDLGTVAGVEQSRATVSLFRLLHAGAITETVEAHRSTGSPEQPARRAYRLTWWVCFKAATLVRHGCQI